MADTEVMSLEETKSPQLQQPEIQSTAKMAKDIHTESLHKVLQKATHSTHSRVPCWPHQLQSRTSPQNLFLEGFRDCASEVIRFLTEEERVDDNSPLLLGLQSHLKIVSKVICHETIMDLDRHDAEMEAGSVSSPHQANLINRDQINSTASSSSTHCLISPVLPKSASTSVSESSATESDVSMSVSSMSDVSVLSVQQDSSDTCHPSHTDSSLNLLDHPVSQQNDEVFSSQTSSFPPHHQISGNVEQRLHVPTNSVQPLRQLALSAASTANLNNITNLCGDIQGSQTTSLANTSPSVSQSEIQCRLMGEELPVNLLAPIGQSSPLPNRTVPSWAQLIHDPFNTRSPPVSTQSAVTVPTGSSAVCVPQTGLPYHLTDFQNQSHPAIQFQNQPSLLPQENPSHILAGQTGLQSQSVFQSPNTSMTTEQDSPGLDQQLSSILELKANFIPGIETSSVASGNFADILLAVESCRFHDDPRVRALAEELTHLIHNEGEDEDDDEEDDDEDDDLEDEYPSDDGNENLNDIVRDNDDESGIEMMDESAEWGNAADMIEQ